MLSSRQQPILVLTIIVSISSLAALPIIIDSFVTPKVLVQSLGLTYFFVIILKYRFNFFNTIGRLQLILILAFLTGLIISSLNSQIPFKRGFLGQFGRGNGVGYYLLAILIMFSAFLVYRESSNSFVSKILRNFSWIIGLYAILQSWGIDIAQIDTTKSRVLLTLGNSNFSGGLLSVFFTYNIVIITKNNSKKLVDWFLVLILLYATIQTGAVQGLLIVLASAIIGINLLVKLNFPKIFKKVIALQFVIYSSAICLGLLGFGPIAEILNRPTLRIRFQYWKIGLQMIRDHPVFGVGPDTFYDRSAVYMAPGSITEITYTRLDAAHNWFINIAANFGMITLIPLILLFTVILCKNVVLWRTSNDLNKYELAISVTFTMLVVDALVSIEQPGLGIWLYYFAGLNLAIQSKTLLKLDNGEPTRTGTRIVLISSVLTFTLLSTSVYLDRIVHDLKFRNGLKTIAMGQASENTYKNLKLNSLQLRSEPEYASKAIDQLAKIGDRASIDEISKEIVEYNPNSLQSLLIRQEVLSVFNRSTEACPIVEKLVPQQPWELLLWQRQLFCDSTLSTSNAQLAELTWPYLKLALKKVNRERPDYLSLLILASFNSILLGRDDEAIQYFENSMDAKDKFDVNTSAEFQAWEAEPFNSNSRVLLLRLKALLN